MDTLYPNAETGCCPRFIPEPWDEKEITWQGKLFVKDRVRCLLHVPLGFGKVVVRNVEKIQAAGALPDQPLMLADHVSPWRIELYIAVGKEVPGCEMATISGTFLSKVFEGPFKDAGKWCARMRDFVTARGRQPGRIYHSYTTCPRCAKYYGKNYTVLLAQV